MSAVHRQDATAARQRPANRPAALVLALALAFALPAAPAAARHAAAAAAERVTLQLKWRHQFQFAGYYAARTQGYYAAEGLDVEIVEGTPTQPPLRTLLSGRAHYAVTGADALEARLRGEPVVVLAVIFQHSPYALLTRRDSGIVRPDDLLGRTIMLADDQGGTEFKAMLLAEGLSSDDVRLVEHSWNNDDLISGRVDAISAYVSVEPFQFASRGVAVARIRPVTYGIDFYGDALITTAAEVAAQRERAAAMRRASLRGWEYAFAHPDELIAEILAMPGVAARGLTADSLRFEAERMRELVLPSVVELGHVNPGRLQRMADTYVKLGLAAPAYSLDGFVFEPNPPFDRRVLYLAVGAAGVLAVLGGLFLLWNWQLRRVVRERTADLVRSEQELRQLNAALEERVHERTVRLEDANRELEAFAYSVSHDLRTPLRHLQGFTQVLLEDYPAVLDETGKGHLERIGAAATRMGQLTDALLGLSQVSLSDIASRPVDLSALAASVAAELQQAQPERAVTLEIQPGLTAQGDPRLLRQVLQNLLENAWKYTSRQATARIAFGAQPVNGSAAGTVYFVRDNGVGFDPAYAGQLFRPFKRLHPAADFAGTGIGLATVQRILQRHGGRIWAESAPDRGATFFFTLGPPPAEA